MDFHKHFQVRPGCGVSLPKYDPGFTGKFADKEDAKVPLDRALAKLHELQTALYAEQRQALLIVFQAMDTGGKDGTIRSIFTGVNPQGCRVTSFKAPSHEEMSHDFLWRIHNAVPPKGYIGIFNRSHYEEVLIVRVHNLAPKKVWARHYKQINDFEEMLSENNVTILKFFLHISKDEQKRRLDARRKDPEKIWKFNPDDLKERKHWDAYTEAYEQALSRCSTKNAPWFIIPSDHKWFRNLAVASIITETLQDMDPQYPRTAESD